MPPLVLQTLEAGGSGRAIVFTNYREGVMGICEALRQHEPLITARSAMAWGRVAVDVCCCTADSLREGLCASINQS